MGKFFVWFFGSIRNRKVASYIPDGATVLDIGCGSDLYLLRKIKNKIKSGVGLDIAAKNSKQGNLTVRRMNIGKKLPFKSESFDIVTMVAFIEHLDRPEELFSECRRVLKKNGTIIITTPTEKAKPYWEFLVHRGLTEEDDTHEHKQYFYPARVEKILKKNSFAVDVSKNFEMGMNYIAVGRKK